MNAFENFDQKKRTVYDIFGNDITTVADQRYNDLQTDTGLRNSSLAEGSINGRYAEPSNLGSYNIKNPDLGLVSNAKDMKKVLTPASANGEKVEFDVSKYEDSVYNLDKLITNTTQNFQTKYLDLYNKISALGPAGMTAADSISMKLKGLELAVNNLREMFNSVNNRDLKLIDADVVSDQIKKAQEEVISQIRSVNINQVFQDEINKAFEQNIDVQVLDEINKKVFEIVTNANALGVIAPENFDTQYIDALISVTESAYDATEKIIQAQADSSETAADATEIIAKTGEQVKAATEFAEDQVGVINDLSEEQANVVRILKEQLDASYSSFEDVDKIVGNFFKNVGSNISASVTDQVRKLVSQVKGAGENADKLDPTYVKTISEASGTMIDLINQLNQDAELTQGDNLDAVLSVMSGVRDFSESINRAQSNAAKFFVEMLKENGNEELIEQAADLLRQSNERIAEVSEKAIANFNANLAGIVERSNEKQAQKVANASVKGTEEYKQSSLNISNAFLKGTQSSVSASQGDLMNSLRSITSSELSMSASVLPGIYRFTGGNFLKNRSKFKSDVQNAQRTNLQVSEAMAPMLQQIERFRAAGDTKNSQKVLEGLSDLVKANASAHLSGMKNVNLHRGQYKMLSNEDKSSLDSFISSSDNAVKALRDAISAIEAIDPQSKALDDLKNINKELSGTIEHVKDIKDDSFDIKDIFSSAMAGVSKAHGLLVGGMGMMGLGMLAPTLSNLKRLFTGSFEAEKRTGQYRYDLARSDTALGANIDYATNRYFVNDMAREYFQMSQGNIGWDQVKNYNIALKRGVGGHYGTSPEEAQADMNRITKNTFGIAQMYGLNENDVAQFMKVQYKDMGKTADEASYMLVSMARAAQAAGQPVASYINNITNVTSSLREYGVTADKVADFMRTMTSGGMRIEEAQGLLSDTAHAGRNMGFNDWGASGFYGILAGQGGDIFANINTGMLSHDSQGRSREEYYQTMTQRLFAEAGLMGAMGGGPGTVLGTNMLMDALAKRGYSQKSVSMMGDAYLHNDMRIFEELLKEADKEKEDSEEGLKKAMQEAEEKIRASGDLMSETAKAQVLLQMTEKRLGEIIETDLKDPLSSMREGLGKLLNNFVSAVELLVKEIQNFSASKTGQAIKDFMGNLNPENAIKAALTVGGGMFVGSKLLSSLGQLGKYAITRNPQNLGTGAKMLAAAPGPLKLLGGAALLAGGAYAYATHDKEGSVSNAAIQTVGDVANSIGRFITGMYDIFTGGDLKAQLFNPDKNQKESDKKFENENNNRLFGSWFSTAEAASRQEESDKKENEDELEKTDFSTLHDQLVKEYTSGLENANDTLEKMGVKESSSKTIEDVRKNDLSKIERDAKNQVTSSHDGMSMTETGVMLAAGGVAAAGLYNRMRPTPVSPETAQAQKDALKKQRSDKLKAIQNARAEHQRNIQNIRSNQANIANNYISGKNGITLPSTSAAYAEAQRQTNNALAAEKERFNKTRSSINQQFGDVSRQKSPSMGSQVTGALKTFGKAAGTNAAISTVMSGIQEYYDYKENPDKFTAGERFSRVAIDALSTTAGMTLGAMAAGPVGAVAGAYGGKLVGDQIKKIFHISDEDGKLMGQQYEDASKWAAGKYTSDTNSLINSNDNRARIAKDELEKHGVKMENMTKSQQQYMDELFIQLKNAGYSDLSAALLAADYTGQYASQAQEDAVKKMKGTNGVDDGYSVQRDAAKARVKELEQSKRENDHRWKSKEDEWKYQQENDLIAYTDDIIDNNPKGEQNKNALIEAKKWKDAIANNKLDDKDFVEHTNPLKLEAMRAARNEIKRDPIAALQYGEQYDYSKLTPEMVNNLYYDKLVSEGVNNNLIWDDNLKWVEEHQIDQSEKGVNPGGNTLGTPEGTKKAEEQAEQIKEQDDRIAKGGHALMEDMDKHEAVFWAGQNAHVQEGEGPQIYTGNEYKADKRTPVYATFDATVSDVGKSLEKGDNAVPLGNYVKLESEGKHLSSVTGRLDEYVVKPGQEVKAGQLIGYAGSSGRYVEQPEQKSIVDTITGNLVSMLPSSKAEAAQAPNVDARSHAVGGGIVDEETAQKLGEKFEPQPSVYQEYYLDDKKVTDSNLIHEYSTKGAIVNKEGKVEAGDGRAPTNKELPEDYQSQTTNDADTSGGTEKNDIESQVGNFTEGYNKLSGELLKLSKGTWSDKFATGRLILDNNVTASFRDRNVFMTPRGVKDRLNMMSGARESSLYGFNTKGHFHYDEEKKEWVQDNTGARAILDKYEKKHGAWGQYHEMKYDPSKSSSLEDTDRLATDPTGLLKDSVARYNKPADERIAEDMTDDLNEKRSVNIAINSIGGGVTKKQVIEYVMQFCELMATDEVVTEHGPRTVEAVLGREKS